jgi:hypothetical protein
MSYVQDAVRESPKRSDTMSYEDIRAHVISRIEQTPTGKEPFYHSFIEQIFPPAFYEQMRAKMLEYKYSDQVQDRKQDNPAFLNKRFNLFTNTDEVTEILRRLFSDPEVKIPLLKKFYINPTREFADSLTIHKEFEYFFTKASRFQNIHVDIPPKFMSFVFYIPEHPASPAEEERNATVLYDKALEPHYPARFKPNSCCVFVPHFYSYHGFASTIDRDVLVMFLIHPEVYKEWDGWRLQDRAPFTPMFDAIEQKLRKYPLIEYGASEERLRAEREACRINAPQGRVVKEEVQKTA